MMKPQEIYDTVVTHLFNQGKRSVDENYCRYHGPDGLKCSVGVLIPEDQYFQELDQGNKTIKDHVDRNPDKFPDWMKENLGLISDLQMAHDKTWNWEASKNMVNELKKIAERWNIKSQVLNNLKYDWEDETVILEANNAAGK